MHVKCSTYVLLLPVARLATEELTAWIVDTRTALMLWSADTWQQAPNRNPSRQAPITWPLCRWHSKLNMQVPGWPSGPWHSLCAICKNFSGIDWGESRPATACPSTYVTWFILVIWKFKKFTLSYIIATQVAWSFAKWSVTYVWRTNVKRLSWCKMRRNEQKSKK